MRISKLILALFLSVLMATGYCRHLSDSSNMIEEEPEPFNPTKEVNELLHKGQKKEALEFTEKQLEENPKNVQLRFIQGVILSDLGKTAEAKAVYEQLIREFPELAEPYNNLAVMYAAEGNTGRARELLEQALLNNAKSLTTYSNLGDVYLAEAASAYAKALKLSPGNKKLKSKLDAIREMQQ